MNDIFYVYLYVDPQNNLPFYVGKGSNGRAFTHLNCKSHNKVLNGFIRNIRKESVEPLIAFHSTNLSEDQSLELEINLIWMYGRKDLGTGCLLNHTDGGEGVSGLIHTEKSKKGMSEGHKGKPTWNKGISQSEEHRKKNSESHKGKPSPNKGKTFSEEIRKKQSEARMGKSPWNKGKQCPTIQGENHPQYGKPVPEERRKKISASLKGKPSPRKEGFAFSEEHIQHLKESHIGVSPSNKGKPMSEEQKIKLRLSVKKLWEDGIYNNRKKRRKNNDR